MTDKIEPTVSHPEELVTFANHRIRLVDDVVFDDSEYAAEEMPPRNKNLWFYFILAVLVAYSVLIVWLAITKSPVVDLSNSSAAIREPNWSVPPTWLVSDTNAIKDCSTRIQFVTVNGETVSPPHFRTLKKLYSTKEHRAFNGTAHLFVSLGTTPYSDIPPNQFQGETIRCGYNLITHRLSIVSISHRGEWIELLPK